MSDIYMDVDAALAEVPVNIMPLLDDTDFKSRETGVAYNAAGMDLVWNFVTTAGAYTQTAVTPTTAGNYDWTHQGDGMYSIEIPASGGASINNDTEGFGWFTGVATGVLPWRGPIIGFRAAALNNSLIDGTTIDVNVTAMAAGVVTATVVATGAIDADAIADNAIDAGAIATGAITNAKFAAGAIDAAAIANAAIDNATFAADVGSTAYATNIIALAADKAIVNAALGTAAELAKVPKSDGTATWNATALAAIQTEANDAIVANRLDELLAADSDIDGAAPPTVGSVFHELLTKTVGSFTYDQTTDSLEAIRDKETDIETDTAEIGAAGAGLTVLSTAAELAKVPKSDGSASWNATALAAIQTEANDAIVANRLDELLAADSDIDGAAPPTVGSVFHELMTKTAGSFTYDQTTDSLEAVRDNEGTAGAGLTAVPWNAAWDAEVESEVDDALGGGTGTALTAIPWNAAWDAEVESEVDDALGSGTGTALTAIPWNAAWDTEVESEATDALVAVNLDHLVGTATGIPAIVAGTYIDQIMDDGTAVYDRTTDSLQAIRDGASAPSAATIADAVWDEARSGHTAGGSFGEGVASVQGNVTGSAASVTGAVGSVTGNVGGSVASVTGAVGSVTGNVGGNVTGSVGSVATGGIAAASFAAGAINAAAVATGAIDADALATDAVAEIADGVWDEATLGHTTSGTFGEQVKTDVDAILVDTAEIGAAGAGLTVLATQASVNTIDDLLDTEVAAILADTNELQTDLTNGGRLDLLIDAILDDTGTAGVVLTAAAVDAILDEVVEGTLTMRQLLRVLLSGVAGITNGSGTVTVNFRDIANSKNRISASVSSGNRTAVTLDGA